MASECNFCLFASQPLAHKARIFFDGKPLVRELLVGLVLGEFHFGVFV